MNRTPEAERLETAAEWLMRLRAARDDDIERWIQWCDLDPRNQQAFDQMLEFWGLADGLADEARSGAFGDVADRPRESPTPHGWWAGFLLAFAHPARAAAAAAVVVMLAAGAWLVAGGYVSMGSRVTLHSTAPLHQASLADGSTVELAAKSRVTVRYGLTQRALELEQGEAYFTVAPNQRRPFVVTAGATRVRAIGTAFDVRRAEDRVTVTVAHGTVEVFPADRAAETMAVRVSAGMQIRWQAGAQDPEIVLVDPASALAWREGRLEYSDEPLSGVIADVNRYASRSVRIEGAAIKALRFTGSILTGATDEWVEALPAGFPVAVRLDGGAYLIEARGAPGEPG